MYNYTYTWSIILIEQKQLQNEIAIENERNHSINADNSRSSSFYDTTCNVDVGNAHESNHPELLAAVNGEDASA